MPKSSLSWSREFADWLASTVDESPADCTPTDPSLPVLVVGAGPAGMAAMAALGDAEVAYEGVESHSQVGGIWDETNPLSSVYEGLHTVTSRFTSHLGPPMPDTWPNYPHHSQVHEYFRAFAKSEGLYERIRFSTRFETAEKTPRGTWLVTLRRGEGDETYQQEFRAVVVASGSHNKSNLVVPRDLWDQAVAAGIDAIHSADYRTPAPYAGKRVLVVGIGNSGSDIAEKVSTQAARTLLAVRTGPWINPQTLGGVPLDKLTVDSAHLPQWLTLGYFHVVRRLLIGSFRRLGLPQPRQSLNDRVPISDRGIVRAIRQGQVVTRSGIKGFDRGMVQFVDPTHPAEPIDAVIFATGFERRYPLLPYDPAQQDRLLFHLFHRSEPGLAFMTELVGLRSCWPIFVEQGRAIAAYFSMEQRKPDRARAFNAQRRLPSPSCKGKLFRVADEYHVTYDIYTRLLDDFVRWLSSDEGATRDGKPK
jgi:Flavin-binding monooxygenase-like